MKDVLLLLLQKSTMDSGVSGLLKHRIADANTMDTEPEAQNRADIWMFKHVKWNNNILHVLAVSDWPPQFHKKEFV